jgi:glycosyltransferase involved in cell wall biosynthesis
MADWLAALTDQAGGEFEIVGLSEPEEQEPGLFDRLRARGVTNLQVVQSLADPVAVGLLSQAAVVHCHGFRQLAELHQLRRRTGASFRCALSIHYFRNGTMWQVPFVNYVSVNLLNKAAHTLHFLSTRSHAEFNSANLLLRRTLPYHIFPLGCDESEFSSDGPADQPQAWRYLAALTAGRPNVVYLANFTRSKRHRWLVEAVATLLLRRNAVLWLFGDGPELPRIQEYVQERSLGDHVILPGRVQRRYIPWLLSHMQVAVCPSLSENSPHAIMEPLFAGVPVVTFDVGTASQLVSDFSRGFVLGEPRVQKEFARKVDIILGDPQLWRRMAEEAKRFVTQFYTWRVCAVNSLAMYRTMLQE